MISVEIKTDAQAQPVILQISLDSLIIPSPTTYAELSIKSTKNNKTTLTAQNKGNYVYSWDPTQNLDKSTSASVIQTFDQDIRYTLTVTSKEGCIATEKFFLYADPNTPPTPPSELKIANVFSPNNDQINDTYYLPFQTQLTDFKAEIFNRWGERIFETTDALFKWDGRYQGEIVSEGKYLLKVYYRENEKEVKWVQPIMVIK
jgi:gliding motility-associated-like protein